MSRALLLRIAAALCLVTCLGHTIGTFKAIPQEQTSMRDTVVVMQQTMVPMPIGSARSYMQILDGNNLCTSLFLLFCGLLLLVLASAARSPVSDRVTLLTALALAGFAMISAFYFFPVPVIFTGVAAVLCIISLTRPSATATPVFTTLSP
jgi:uncharacterized membrane protein